MVPSSFNLLFRTYMLHLILFTGLFWVEIVFSNLLMGAKRVVWNNYYESCVEIVLYAHE